LIGRRSLPPAIASSVGGDASIEAASCGALACGCFAPIPAPGWYDFSYQFVEMIDGLSSSSRRHMAHLPVDMA